MKGCTYILEPALKHIVILNASQKHISADVKQTVIIPVYKKGNSACVQNYRRARACLVNSLLIFFDHFWYYSILVNTIFLKSKRCKKTTQVVALSPFPGAEPNRTTTVKEKPRDGEFRNTPFPGSNHLSERAARLHSSTVFCSLSNASS